MEFDTLRNSPTRKYIFGHSISKEPGEFENAAAALEYFRSWLPTSGNFRYRTTYTVRDVQSIILSFNGNLLAELAVASVTDPTDKDRTEYRKTRKVYHISEIRIFADQNVKASDVGLTGIQFGNRAVSSEVYRQILDRVGGFEEHIVPNTQEAHDLTPLPADMVVTRTYRRLPDTQLARRVKSMHNHECQICGETMKLPDGSLYAEAHHIHPLGEGGPDDQGNILCLCPNHHAELDYLVVPISLSDLRSCDGHTVNRRYVDYHNSKHNEISA
jgi:hypothetical protein